MFFANKNSEYTLLLPRNVSGYFPNATLADRVQAQAVTCANALQ
jgi:hypothetical protein